MQRRDLSSHSIKIVSFPLKKKHPHTLGVYSAAILLILFITYMYLVELSRTPLKKTFFFCKNTLPMLTSSSWLVSAAARPPCIALLSQHRSYSVIRKGHDVQQPTLFHTLGFGKDEELRMLHRTPEELKLGMVRQAKLLDDDSGHTPAESTNNKTAEQSRSVALPAQHKNKQEKLKGLRSAFKKLNDPVFRSQYVPFHCSSVDVNLHVLCEGGQHCTNFNPEHETLNFSSTSQLPQRSFGEFKEAFQAATHAHDAKAAAHDATKHLAPKDGPDIDLTLRVTFQEAMDGVQKSVLVRRYTKCLPCQGSGDKLEKRPRRCPQCSGNGTITLPSATYVIKKPCDYCVGKGVMPPPRCRSCRGTGTNSVDETIAVQVPPGTHTALVQTIPHKGQCGTRGGKTGNLLVTYLVEEHRWFHRIGLDLHIALPIPLSIALLGGYVQVPLLGRAGESKAVHVPPNMKNGEIINVPGCGVQSADGKVTGSLRIHSIVVIPKGEALTGSQRHALSEMVRPSGTEQQQQMSFEEAKKTFKSWLTS